MSDYLEKHRNSYYASITAVREKNDIEQWLRFFLQCVIETAEKGVTTFNKLLALEKDNESIIQQMGSRSANALTVVKDLYVRPIIDAKRIATICNISAASTYSLIGQLENHGILTQITSGKRNRMYMMKQYMDLFY